MWFGNKQLYFDISQQFISKIVGYILPKQKKNNMAHQYLQTLRNAEFISVQALKEQSSFSIIFHFVWIVVLGVFMTAKLEKSPSSKLRYKDFFYQSRFKNFLHRYKTKGKQTHLNTKNSKIGKLVEQKLNFSYQAPIIRRTVAR